MGRFEPIGLRAEKLMQQCQALPRALMLCWLADFDNEAGNPNGIMRGVRAKDRQSLKVHPVHAAVGPHNAELTRFVRRAIRPERLHRNGAKGAPILRVHTLQEQMKFSRRIARNSEDLPQFARPISFARVEVSLEESHLVRPPAFHSHSLSHSNRYAQRWSKFVRMSLKQTWSLLLKTGGGARWLHPNQIWFQFS
jgi:hypothetical protein